MSGQSRIREKDLIEPVLKLIAEYGDDEKGLEISEIDHMLRKRMVLSDLDKETLKGRRDDRFSQVVRNLVSHRTLEKRGLAEYHKEYGSFKGSYVLTARGKAFVQSGEEDQMDLFR
jgi:hypothetical protein